jgi:hypothetical protein
MKILSILFMLLFVATSVSANQESVIQKEIKVLESRVFEQKREVIAHGSTKQALHEISKNEGRLLRKHVTYQTYLFLKKQGCNRNMIDLQEMIDSAFNCSFIFMDLGENQHERFRRILGWAYTETNFKKNIVSAWKKGQHIKSLNVTISYDSTDYGTWQINDVNDMSLKDDLWSLYLSGVINFKIVKVSGVDDLFDIPTNCAFRCLVEAERKRIGLNWKQDKAKAYLKFIEARMTELEKNACYDKNLVEQYYYKEPIKRFQFK